MSTIAIMQNDKMGPGKTLPTDQDYHLDGWMDGFDGWMDDQGEAIHLGAFHFMSTWQVRHKSGWGPGTEVPRSTQENSLGEARKFYVNIINDNILHCPTTLGRDPKEKSHAVRGEKKSPDRIFPFAPACAIINLKFSTPFALPTNFH